MNPHKVRSRHAEDDASGRVFAPGETIPDLDVNDPYNRSKIERGVFVEVEEPEAAEAAPAVAVDATDAAQALAAEKGVDLAQVKGTGKGGRIVESDVEAAAESHDSQEA